MVCFLGAILVAVRSEIPKRRRTWMLWDSDESWATPNMVIYMRGGTRSHEVHTSRDTSVI